MPASESPAGTAPSVLLVEEYDALAAAITSALKKFAPDHRTVAVESLTEAEAAATQTHPQLFVIDFDPPQPKAVEFLNRICAAHPESRALIIASGTSHEFLSERFGPNGVQFIEKPFELASFGAAVQALLGPWTEAGAGGSRGTLRDLNLRDLVPLECVSGVTAILKVVADGGRTGEVHFLDGHICHASAPGLDGSPALAELMRWKRAHGSEAERPTNAPRTIQGPWQHVFLEALRKAKPSAEPATLPTSSLGGSPPAKVPRKSGQKIVVIDDTEMLAIFVEDVLSTADPNLQIFTARTGNEGAQLAGTSSPDLVLLDYSLPDLRGDQVCERLLADEATARIPVVMMSGHVPEMMATAERCSNVVATIAKPFMSGALISLVKNTLAKGPLPASPRKEPGLASPVGDRPIRVVPPAAEPAKRSASPITVVEQVKPIPPAAAKVTTPPPTPRSSISVKVTERPRTVSPPTAPPILAPQALRPPEMALLESLPSSSPIQSMGFAAQAGGVILGFGVEVLSVQFTARFQVNTILARPSPATLSLTRASLPSVAENRWGSGFELGAVELNPDGRVRTIRVLPMRRPAGSIHARNGFDIKDVELVKNTANVQLTAGMSAPMTLQVLAFVRVVGVELSDRFEVAELVLQPEGSRVRARLESHAQGGRGMEFETAGFRLDPSSRITEFVLRLASND